MVQDHAIMFFSISDSGNYEIFIKNTSSKTVTIEGGYSVY